MPSSQRSQLFFWKRSTPFFHPILSVAGLARTNLVFDCSRAASSGRQAGCFVEQTPRNTRLSPHVIHPTHQLHRESNDSMRANETHAVSPAYISSPYHHSCSPTHLHGPAVVATRQRRSRESNWFPANCLLDLPAPVARNATGHRLCASVPAVG
jgi:hypothetical protein